MIRYLSVYIAFIGMLTSDNAFAGKAFSFSQAKKLAVEIYQGKEEAFYSGCRYGYTGKKLVPIAETCGYQPRIPITKSGKKNARAVRIEWEHVMPAWVFGHQRKCWQLDLNSDGKKDGRKGCKKDPVFVKMEGDLHNLVPAPISDCFAFTCRSRIGELNGDRSNYAFAMLPGEARVYGKPDFEVDFKARKIEPRPEIRGDIARIYFYMASRYKLRLSKQDTQLFTAWAKQDPVSAWEKEKGRTVSILQGNKNPYVE